MGRAMETARVAFVLKQRAEGKTYKQIGEILGISLGRVRQLVVRAEYRQHEAQRTKLYTDWRVKYDFDILVPIIDQIKGLTKDEQQG
jgi:orotate phosphoribosyltransferase-like protein